MTNKKAEVSARVQAALSSQGDAIANAASEYREVSTRYFAARDRLVAMNDAAEDSGDYSGADEFRNYGFDAVKDEKLGAAERLLALLGFDTSADRAPSSK